jgi:hypothetical protein
MGVLTIDMRRLRGEIDAAHGMRESLMHDLARSTRELKRGVNAMLTASHASHLQTARRTHADCSAFVAGVEKAVNHIRGTVAGLRKEFASDIQGARRAWDGGGAPRKAKAAAKHGAGGRSKHT